MFGYDMCTKPGKLVIYSPHLDHTLYRVNFVVNSPYAVRVTTNGFLEINIFPFHSFYTIFPPSKFLIHLVAKHEKKVVNLFK